MNGIDKDLRELNQWTFDAESRPDTPIGGKNWKAFLQDVLAHNFSIKRANGAVQNKGEMIEFVEGSPPAKRDVDPKSVQVVAVPGDAQFGVVTSVLTFNEKKYHNTKVFTRQKSGTWLCVYWQVLEVP